MTYRHGYREGDEGFTAWREAFPVEPQEVEVLYRLLVEQEVWSNRWREGDPPEGGDTEWLEATAQGQEASIR